MGRTGIERAAIRVMAMVDGYFPPQRLVKLKLGALATSDSSREVEIRRGGFVGSLNITEFSGITERGDGSSLFLPGAISRLRFDPTLVCVTSSIINKKGIAESPFGYVLLGKADGSVSSSDYGDNLFAQLPDLRFEASDGKVPYVPILLEAELGQLASEDGFETNCAEILLAAKQHIDNGGPYALSTVSPRARVA